MQEMTKADFLAKMKTQVQDMMTCDIPDQHTAFYAMLDAWGVTFTDVSMDDEDDGGLLAFYLFTLLHKCATAGEGEDGHEEETRGWCQAITEIASLDGIELRPEPPTSFIYGEISDAKSEPCTPADRPFWSLNANPDASGWACEVTAGTTFMVFYTNGTWVACQE